MISFLQLQKSIYQCLTNAKLNVYDEVPKTAKFPYIVISNPEYKPFDTKNSSGQELNVNIHIWSTYPGKKEVYELIEKVIEALSYPLKFTDKDNYINHKKIIRCNVIDDIDGVKRHGIIQIRYYINKK